MTLDVGNDFSCFPDLDLSRTIERERLVAEWVAREWTTKRGALFYAQHIGDHVGRIINGDLSPRELRAWEGRLSNSAIRVPGVLACTVRIASVDANVVITGSLQTSDRPIDMILTLSEAARVLSLETKLRGNAG